MYCPHRIIINKHWRYLHIYVQREEKSDYRSRPTPIGQRINPLRYWFSVSDGRYPKRWKFSFNRDAWLNRVWVEANWILWKRKVWEFKNERRK